MIYIIIEITRMNFFYDQEISRMNFLIIIFCRIDHPAKLF